MEARWERRFEHRLPERAALCDALEAAGVADSLHDQRPLPGGLVNLNIRVTLGEPTRAAVFRVYLRDPAAAAKEAALLERVRGLVPAPAVLAWGTLPLELGGHVAERPWLLLSWVPGRALSEVLGTLEEDGLRRAGREIGMALGRLHACATPELGFLDATLAVSEPMGTLQDTWRSYLQGLLKEGHAVRRLGDERVRGLRAYVAQHASDLAPLEGRWTLLHADCKPTNVFVDAAGALTGFLDWEFAWSGPPLFDLGQMLRMPVPPAYERALLDGYRAAGGVLVEGWRHTARLLDLMNLVGFLGQEGERRQQTRDVLALVDVYL